MSTIRVTVGDVEVRPLNEAQLSALRAFPDRCPFWGLRRSEKFQLVEDFLINDIVDSRITPVGLAVLEHYDECAR